jgi:hypothetical protein
MKEDFMKILEMGSERAVAELAVKAIGNNDACFREVLDLCFIEQYPISMRAARVIQLCCEKRPKRIYPCLEEIVTKVLESRIDGVRRNFLKIFAEFIDIRKISDPGPLLKSCFECMLNFDETPAIRIYSMEIVFRISQYEPDLKNELISTIEFIVGESPPSIKNKGMKILRLLGVPNWQSVNLPAEAMQEFEEEE